MLLAHLAPFGQPCGEPFPIVASCGGRADNQAHKANLEAGALANTANPERRQDKQSRHGEHCGENHLTLQLQAENTLRFKVWKEVVDFRLNILARQEIVLASG